MKRQLFLFLRQKLGSDRVWALKALVRIADNQLADELGRETVVYNNGIGFTVQDARILSSLAKFYANRRFLTDKQMALVFKKMPKYAGQLMSMGYFDMAKLEKAYMAGAF